MIPEHSFSTLGDAPLPGSPAGAPEPPRCGSSCPACQQGRLDYNGLLELECPRCGYILTGGGGCS